MKKIVIAGGTGFLGKVLTEYFVFKGYQVVILSRFHHLDKENVSYLKWDAKTDGYWSTELEGADALINLNGKSVDCRYTKKNKQLIYDTRIDATYTLNEVISCLIHPPKVFINAASATIYRHTLNEKMDEDTGELGNGFSVDVCKKWESTFFQERIVGVRKVALRSAIVLGKSDGALKPLKRLVRMGLGGRQGRGNQFVSWLHQLDFARIIDFVIQNEQIQGVYNASSPNPVQNKSFMKQLRVATGHFIRFPLPSWLLKLGAVLIQTETELILKSRRVVPKRLIESGFKFKYPELNEALLSLN